MEFAYVTSNILDLRSEPDIRSERVHQVLFGALLKILKAAGAYVFVEDSIGYRGWSLAGGVVRVPAARIEDVRRGPLVVVRALKARLYSNHGLPAGPPYVVYYGTILASHAARGDEVVVRLPDGVRYAIKRAQIAPINGRRSAKPRGSDLVREARRFLGVPYLWGGVSTPGFDCSGLVHTICARFGVTVPRDTKDQIGAGVSIDRSTIRTGDLLFFDRHVGFAIGRSRIIHSSVAGQGVRINSLTAADPDYRADLDHSFREARRII